ncbi:MAG: hypothetical protein RLZZ461_1946, partial [Planctomycetota bacterium]
MSVTAPSNAAAPWSAAPSVPNDLLAISDLDGETITSLLELAVDLKARP